MNRPSRSKGLHRLRPLMSAAGASKEGNKVIAITEDGKEVEGTVIFERKANYKKPAFA
ncbi:hypothetical protein O9H85_19235 [Paenibacillus filicis]|uniref:Uncharacterized protein n=1 Tax=Paenibacillus gyeongsangnamensis TaxID=3388067 RepID=A0ABT4QCD7_9BACL|nr:hypothetical protein [Paenibacillus filicis]MCZ8514516.1 hypothetical protein [Paenibacillus filicis]